MDTRHPRRLLAPEQVLMRFSIIYDRPSTNSPEGVEEISDKDRMPRATQRGSRRPNIAVLSQPNQGPVAFRLFYNRFRACQR